jgi:uncharacterized protein (DUF2132 family)
VRELWVLEVGGSNPPFPTSRTAGVSALRVSAMSEEQPKNPLHGITLKMILDDLVDRRGFEDLGRQISIRCFTHDPSLKSSLKFLRRTEWARAKVEQLYLHDHGFAKPPRSS